MACCFKGSLDYWLISIACNFTGDSVLEILLFVETNLMLLAVSSLSFTPSHTLGGTVCVWSHLFQRSIHRSTLIHDRSCLPSCFWAGCLPFAVKSLLRSLIRSPLARCVPPAETHDRIVQPSLSFAHFVFSLLKHIR